METQKRADGYSVSIIIHVTIIDSTGCRKELVVGDHAAPIGCKDAQSKQEHQYECWPSDAAV